MEISDLTEKMEFFLFLMEENANFWLDRENEILIRTLHSSPKSSINKIIDGSWCNG